MSPEWRQRACADYDVHVVYYVDQGHIDGQYLMQYMHANLEKKTTPSDGKDKRNLAKSKLMADLFSGDSENKMEERSDSRPDQLSASSNVKSAKKDKSDSQPRRPNLRSELRRKTLELDDDILGTRRSNKGSNRQQEKEIETKSESDLNKGDAASSASQVKAGNRGKDDWLFNGLGNEASKAKKNTVTEPAEPKEDGTQKPSSSASKSPDWLGSLLSCDKKSSGGSNQVVSTSSMPDGISAPSVHHSPATPHFESKDIGGGHPSKDLNTTLPDAKSASSTTTLVLPASSGTNEQLQLLKEHQDAQLQNAAQMKAQQDLIEAQMALQVQQQQQQMATK
ncbi:uncharacterized protein LOC122254170 [Penaeus japonicus]|uniref:uncharacterized protein LOC122254170 n=1 Tax=Penaeus japonicus TaxID=27405 RepID=UPI001C70F192|nr:uncharacterized protein LOC122254170 [Penaeus japonicus]